MPRLPLSEHYRYAQINATINWDILYIDQRINLIRRKAINRASDKGNFRSNRTFLSVLTKRRVTLYIPCIDIQVYMMRFEIAILGIPMCQLSRAPKKRHCIRGGCFFSCLMGRARMRLNGNRYSGCSIGPNFFISYDWLDYWINLDWNSIKMTSCDECVNPV